MDPYEADDTLGLHTADVALLPLPRPPTLAHPRAGVIALPRGANSTHLYSDLGTLASFFAVTITLLSTLFFSLSLSPPSISVDLGVDGLGQPSYEYPPRYKTRCFLQGQSPVSLQQGSIDLVI
jgi:hypothetical protein